MKKRAPTKKQLTRLLNWLSQNGLSVYGDHIDLKTGKFFGGCRDYTTASQIQRYVKARRLQEEVQP